MFILYGNRKIKLQYKKNTMEIPIHSKDPRHPIKYKQMPFINVEDYYRCHIIYNNLRGARVLGWVCRPTYAFEKRSSVSIILSFENFNILHLLHSYKHF